MAVRWHLPHCAAAAIRHAALQQCAADAARQSGDTIGLSHWRPSGVYIGRFVEELGNLPSCRGSGRRNRGAAAAAAEAAAAEEEAAAAEEAAKLGHTP